MRHVRYAYAAALRCREVDLCEASAETRDHSSFGMRSISRPLTPSGTVVTTARTRGPHLADERLAIRCAPDLVHRVVALELLECGNINLSRYEDFGFAHFDDSPIEMEAGVEYTSTLSNPGPPPASRGARAPDFLRNHETRHRLLRSPRARAALIATAQSWKPVRHVEIIAPSAAGGGSDTVARLVHRILQENKIVEAPLNVVNKAGAGGTLAWSGLNQHTGDGHHIAISTANLLSNHISGTSTLHYTELTPLAQLFSEYAGIAVRSESQIKSGKDLIEQLRRDPAALSAAVGTTLGSVGHIALALTTKAAGNDAKKLKAVVFPGAGNALTALLGGHVDMMASPVSNLVPHAADGKLRIIAVAAPKRLGSTLAQTPTLREHGVAVEVDNLRGVVGPKGMTPAQIAYWESALKRMTDTAAWRSHLEKNAWENSFTGAEGSAQALKTQYQEMRAGMAELGLAKN